MTYFWTLAELRQRLYAAYPEMKQVAWIDEALRELFENAAPSPQSWEYRMIAPSAFASFAKDVGKRIGREVSV